jgi:hypothetical protein
VVPQKTAKSLEERNAITADPKSLALYKFMAQHLLHPLGRSIGLRPSQLWRSGNEGCH